MNQGTIGKCFYQDQRKGRQVVVSQYVINCYSCPARLFIIGGKEIASKEGTTQGDPLAMAIYAIGLTPLLEMLVHILIDTEDNTKMVAFADDLTGVGGLRTLKDWWKTLCELGPKFGYYPQPTKSWLIVKERYKEESTIIFAGSNIQITTSGQRHLGAVIGDANFQKQYCEKMVTTWVDEIKLLSEIALIEPQAAYASYVSGFQHKFTYFIRTIKGFEQYLQPVEEAVRHRFIPAITGGHTCNDDERALLSLPPRLGGLGIKEITKIAEFEYDNSIKMTQDLTSNILGKEAVGDSEKNTSQTKLQIRKDRQARYEHKLNEIRSHMNELQQRINEANQEPGSYNWLTTLPLKEFKYNLNKEQFWDALRLRYGWCMPRIPSECACGNKFNIQHALSCKKGGFITLRHNEVRDITASFLNEVCKDVRKEPSLIKLTGEQINEKATKTGDEARLDVSALGFWVPGQRVFCDIRVFDHNAQRYRNTNLKKCFIKNEEEKKKHYNERVLNIENASFTPLVFNINGGMARECKKFFSRLTEMVAEKRNVHVSVATSFIRTKLSFSLLRSMLLCIRGSRSLKRIVINEDDDMELAELSRIKH